MKLLSCDIITLSLPLFLPLGICVCVGGGLGQKERDKEEGGGESVDTMLKDRKNLSSLSTPLMGEKRVFHARRNCPIT